MPYFIFPLLYIKKKTKPLCCLNFSLQFRTHCSLLTKEQPMLHAAHAEEKPAPEAKKHAPKRNLALT